MKKLIYLFFIPAILIFFSCGPGISGNDAGNIETNDPTYLQNEDTPQNAIPDESKLQEIQEPHEQKISTAELPSEISANVKKDEYLSTLDLDGVVKIQNNDQTYYELTFRDGTNKIIAVIFDDRGNKMTI